MPQNQDWAETFFHEVEALIDKHSDRIPEMVSILQTVVVALTCDMAESMEEAGNMLHTMVDECLDEVSVQEEMETSLSDQ
jgi:hypothetical protein